MDQVGNTHYSIYLLYLAAYKIQGERGHPAGSSPQPDWSSDSREALNHTSSMSSSKPGLESTNHLGCTHNDSFTGAADMCKENIANCAPSELDANDGASCLDVDHGSGRGSCENCADAAGEVEIYKPDKDVVDGIKTRSNVHHSNTIADGHMNNDRCAVESLEDVFSLPKCDLHDAVLTTEVDVTSILPPAASDDDILTSHNGMNHQPVSDVILPEPSPQEDPFEKFGIYTVDKDTDAVSYSDGDHNTKTLDKIQDEISDTETDILLRDISDEDQNTKAMNEIQDDSSDAEKELCLSDISGEVSSLEEHNERMDQSQQSTLPYRPSQASEDSQTPEIELKTQETQTELVPTVHSEVFSELDTPSDEEEPMQLYNEEVLTM